MQSRRTEDRPLACLKGPETLRLLLYVGGVAAADGCQVFERFPKGLFGSIGEWLAGDGAT